MASSDTDADADDDVLLLVHQIPLDIDDSPDPAHRRLAHLLPPLHHAPPPSPPSPFCPPPPPQAASSAEPRISFRGWLGAPRHWDLWVAKLRPLHARLWRRLGIHDAVLASTYRFKRDASPVLHLACFWSPATGTFVFPWGEATVTLQDIDLLAGLPAHGGPVTAPLPPEWRPDEAALNGVRLGFNRSACKKAHLSAWVKHFLTDHSDPVLEHAAFLALWLTRFVLPGHPDSTMRQAVFPIAVRLARRDRVALAPAVLASLYRDLRDIKAFLVATATAATTGNSDMMSSLSLYAPLYILQLWIWERFPVLRPGRENPVRDGEPMAARWHDLSRKINPTLIREALSTGDNFVWQSYDTSVSGWVRSGDLAGNDELTSLAHCLRPCELVGMDCIEQYLPHRVSRQFGLDQDVPGDVPRANQNWAVAWQTYELEGKNVAFFIPQSEPGITARYAQWWRQKLPHSFLNAGAPTVPVEFKSSKRKVKKTPAAMEAEAEKERRMKKARVLPSNDKKRKLEELYDAKMSDWLANANGISDAAGSPFQRGSFLKYDTGSDEALLPNVGTSNDDVVLLVPRNLTTSPPVIPRKVNSINLSIRDSRKFIADRPQDIYNEPEGGVTATPEDEKLNIPVDRSLDTTDKPEEGAAAVMDLANEATDVSATPEEVPGPVIEEKEEKVAIEGPLCVEGMRPPEKNIAILMEADEGNAVSEEVGRAVEEAVEAAQQSEQEVDAGVMNNSCHAVALPEEALPIQHTNNPSACSEVSGIMQDGNVSGGLGINDGETACRNSVVEDHREVPRVEEIDGGEINRAVEKDSEEKPQEAPQIERVESAPDVLLMGTDNDCEQKTVPPTVEKVATSNSMAAAYTGDPEAENAQVDKDLNLTKKYAEDIPSQLAEGVGAEQEQLDTLRNGSAVEESKEFYEVDQTDMAEPKMHSHIDTAKTHEAAEVECTEIDGAERLTGRDIDGKLVDVPEAGHAEVEKENIREQIVDVSDEKLAEDSQVELADVEDVKSLMKEDTNNKSEDVPELENTGSEIIRGSMEQNSDGRLKEFHDILAEGEQANGNQRDSDRIHDVNAKVEHANGHQRDGVRAEGILQVTLQTRDESRWLEKEAIEENTAEVPQVKYANLKNESLTGEDTREKCCANGEDVPEKDVDASKEAYKVLQAEREGCKVLVEKTINDALGVQQATEGQDKSLTEKDIHDHVEEITLVEQVDGQSERLTRIRTEEIPEEASQSQENEFDTDMVEESKNLTGGEMPCNSGTLQLKGGLMEVSHEGMMKEQFIQNVELINQREPSSGATAMKVEGLYDHKTLDMHKEMALKQSQDHRITCENREITILEDTYMLDSGVKSNLATLEVDETHAAGGIENHESLDLDKQQAMKETEDLGTANENSQMIISEVADVLVCSEYQIDPTSMEVNAVDSTEGIQNQELLYNKEQLAMEEKQDLGTSVENNKINMSEDADALVCSEYQINPTGMEVNTIESTKGIQSQELFDNKQQLAMEEGQDLGKIAENNKMNMSENVDILVCSEYQVDPTSMEVNASTQGIQNQELLDKEEQLAVRKGQDIGTTIENNKINISQDLGIQNKELLDDEEDQVTAKIMDCITDGSGISLEGTNKPGGGGANTFVVADDVSDSIQNKEALSMEETWEDKQHHGVEHANDKISEHAIMVDSGELKSDATVVEVNMSASRQGTLNRCSSIAEKELELQEKQDQQMAVENTNRDLADVDALECGGGKPDGAVKMLHETILTAGAANIAGCRISPENKQEEATFEEHDITEVEGSESNLTAGKKPEGNFPPEPENLVEVKQENLENETEMSISRENDETSGKDQASVEVTMAPSNVDEQGENDNEWAEESTKSYDKLASDPINTACHQSIRSGNSDIEEVKRTHNTRSMYLKDIKESLGRIRAEPSSRVRTTSVGYYSRHAVQEPISVCKEIHNSARDFVRDRAPELVVTSPSEETSRWRQEQYALQVLEDVQNSRVAEKTRMEMEIRVLKAQIASMERQVMNLDHFTEVKSRSKRH